jgi:hypothetical protein
MGPLFLFGRSLQQQSNLQRVLFVLKAQLFLEEEDTLECDLISTKSIFWLLSEYANN